ncbi:MAG: DUF1684 domain-containing protein [Caldilineaceae bacterium]
MSINRIASYVRQIEAWRHQREEELRAPDGWFSLTGLFPLQDGYYTVGSNPASDISLPARAPDHVGVIEFRKGKAKLNVALPGQVLVEGLPLRQIELTDNGDRKKPTLVTVGTVTLFLHKFGDQYAIRVKDSTNPAIAAFAGCVWYDVQPDYRIQGKFRAYQTPQLLPIKTIVDTNTVYNSVGTLDFTLHGHPFSLLATDRGQPDQLFVSFRDATAGKQTYGPGRFLSVDLDAEGNAWLDFNKAYNPPCAFSPYATCPLPPQENILPLAIEAGERTWKIKLTLPADKIAHRSLQLAGGA